MLGYCAGGYHTDTVACNIDSIMHDRDTDGLNFKARGRFYSVWDFLNASSGIRMVLGRRDSWTVRKAEEKSLPARVRIWKESTRE